MRARGRPRTSDRDAVLRKALEVFRERGVPPVSVVEPAGKANRRTAALIDEEDLVLVPVVLATLAQCVGVV